jgi:hypothetical protein
MRPTVARAFDARPRTQRWAASLAVSVCAFGCGAPALTPPDAAVRAYAEATARGDAAALHGMLSEEARRGLTAEEVRARVGDAKAELAEHGALALRAIDLDARQADAAVSSSLVVRADVPLDGGSRASLTLEEGAFAIDDGELVPTRARSPIAVLARLRAALARRDYAALVRLLSPTSARALEESLGSLVEGLDQPDALLIDERGDGAVVRVPGGHVVRLRREGGAWFVDDLR